MNQIDDGGLAFPSHEAGPATDPRSQISGGGMSLRDYFAAKAMQSILLAVSTNTDAAMALDEGAGTNRVSHTDRMALEAYSVADAMIKARAVKP